MKNNFLPIVFLVFFSCTFKNESKIYTGNLNFWSDNLNEIELAMSYILTNDEYAELRTLSEQDKINFLDKYWESIDPDKSTKDNELFNEFKLRVIESKKLFSDFDTGIFSDRAKIYIKFGPPSEKYKTNSYNSVNNDILVWKYKTGYEFSFIIDTFGRYKLIKN
tara:strand:- start:359 stop:850 length:492 start_codon:yes stop_codon:yes gene_type:complete